MNAAELENVCKMSECLHKLKCLWENISVKGWNFMHFRGQSHLTLYCLNLTEAHIKQCFHCYSWPRMFPSFQKRKHELWESAQIFTILKKSRRLYLHHHSNHRIDHQMIILGFGVQQDTYPKKLKSALLKMNMLLQHIHIQT